MNLKKGYRTVKLAIRDFVDDNAMTLGAALAFYAALSIAPLLLILLAITSLLGADTQQRVVQQIEGTVGPQAGSAIQNIVQAGAAQPSAGTISAIIGFAVLLFSASGVFVQMQSSLNTIWDVQPKSGGVWRWLVKRFLSLVMILGIGLLLLASLALSAVVNALFRGSDAYIWQSVWQVADFVVSFFIYALLFALIYKVLPDVKTSWQDIRTGAIMTAVLFVIGKFLLGLYLGRSAVGSPYGAAGSLIVLLLWIYYSALIFFLGAELTQAYARLSGRELTPAEGAERTPEAKEEEKELQETTSDRRY